MDIATKLTKPVKVTKQLHRGKWAPIIANSDNNVFQNLVTIFVRKYGTKLPSLEYAVIKVCQNMEDTLYYDLHHDLIASIASHVGLLNVNSKNKQQICHEITEFMCQL